VSGSWLWRTPRRDAQLRLFCFPHAGGGASTYRGWSTRLPREIEVLPVQLPGREERLGEHAFADLRVLVEHLGTVLQPWLDVPFAFFGHSMGSLIAFELARWLRRAANFEPRHLYVSGHRAPHLPDPGPFFHAQPDRAVVEELRRLCGTRPEVLDNAELMQLFLPTVRADLSVCETYAFVPDAPLSCPISVYGGTRDTEASVAELVGWREHTTSDFRLRMFDGDHFYLTTGQDRFLATFTTEVAA
jgi:surfactin synthase thioesterase subunit